MHTHVRLGPALAAALLVSACKPADKTPLGADSSATAAAKTPACGDANSGITVPAGFCVTVFADSIAHGRHATVASNGDVYVTIEGTGGSKDKSDPPPPDSTAQNPPAK